MLSGSQVQNNMLPSPRPTLLWQLLHEPNWELDVAAKVLSARGRRHMTYQTRNKIIRHTTEEGALDRHLLALDILGRSNRAF